jgi:hypothetical protein
MLDCLQLGDHGDEVSENEYQEYREQLEREFKMRMESVVKGYEVKISREQETFELKEMKHIEEIEYLKRQLKERPWTKSRADTPIEQHCNICSNGEVIALMKKMLEALEVDHKGCLSEKAILNAKITALEQKMQVLETQNEKGESRYSQAKQEIKQLKTEREEWEKLENLKLRELQCLEKEHKAKEATLEQEVSKHKLALQQLENEVAKMRQK